MDTGSRSRGGEGGLEWRGGWIKKIGKGKFKTLLLLLLLVSSQRGLKDILIKGERELSLKQQQQQQQQQQQHCSNSKSCTKEELNLIIGR